MYLRCLSVAGLLLLCCRSAWAFVELPIAVASDSAPVERGVVHIIAVGVDAKGNAQWGTGTGVLLNRDGFVATNYHVIQGAKLLYVNPNGSKVSALFVVQNPNAKLVSVDQGKDLAILKVESIGNVEPAMLASVTPEKGASVSAVGYPGLADDKMDKSSIDFNSDATVTRGVLSRAREDTTWGRGKGAVKTIQHSAPVSWGNSGGPLLDGCGRVIGLNTQVVLSDERVRVVAAGYYWAVNVVELVDILKARGIDHRLQGNRCMRPSELMWTAIWVFVVVSLAMVAVMVLLWRRPRERIIQIAERLSHYGGRRASPAEVFPPRPRPQPSRPAELSISFAVSLDGVDGSGRRHLLHLTPAMLAAGVVIGREPRAGGVAIPVPEISREHVRIYARDAALYVRDLESTNGTRISGRRVSPRNAELLAHGDRLELGPVVLKVSFFSEGNNGGA